MTKQQELLLSTIENLKKQRELFLTVAETLAGSVEIRDTYTGEHSRRVTHFALLLGEQLHLSAEDLEWIRFGTPLHDIGKIGIADSILRKPDKLTPAEFEQMKLHTVKGAEFVAPIPDFQPMIPIIRSHHERWDGKGYPDGLAGEDIPRLARLVAVANAFDAMVFDTPYRQGRTVDIAFAEIETERGRQFAPDVVTAFLQIREKIVEEMQRFEKKR